MSRTEEIAEDKKRPPKVIPARISNKVTYKRPVEQRDFQRTNIHFGVSENYAIQERIGYGRFSRVYNGRNLVTKTDCVVKVLRKFNEFDIKQELHCLVLLNGGPNIIHALDVIRIDEPGDKCSIGIVFEKVQNTDSRFLYPLLSDLHIRYYLYQLLRALKYAHSKGLMHGDLKPDNIVIDHRRKILRLIDWGRGTPYMPGQAYSTRVCTLYYRAPEALLGYRHYDYAIDMWAFGCIAAGMIFRKEVFFAGLHEMSQLQCIARVLGREKLEAYIQKYRIRCNLHGIIDSSYVGLPLQSFASPDNNDTLTCSGIDFLNKLLVYDHRKRLTAIEAKKHAYFQLIKKDHVHPSTTPQCSQAIPEFGRNNDIGDIDESIAWDTTLDDLPELDPNFARALLISLIQKRNGGHQEEEQEQEENDIHSPDSPDSDFQPSGPKMPKLLSPESEESEMHVGNLEMLQSEPMQSQDPGAGCSGADASLAAPLDSICIEDLFSEDDDTYDYIESSDSEEEEKGTPKKYDFHADNIDSDSDEQSNCDSAASDKSPKYEPQRSQKETL